MTVVSVLSQTPSLSRPALSYLTSPSAHQPRSCQASNLFTAVHFGIGSTFSGRRLPCRNPAPPSALPVSRTVTCTLAQPLPDVGSRPKPVLDAQSAEHLDDEEHFDGASFSWHDNWYPVSLLEDLDPSRPTKFQLLGIDLVLWRDAEKQWRAFSDLCPHRLAPLSEGRLDSYGNLQCSYHGWAFRGDSTCASIPQAATEGAEAGAVTARKACATNYPTMESQGLLFVWPDAKPEGWEECRTKEPPKLPDDFSDPKFSTVTIQRDLYYGYDTLMENVSDPSHINFAHHKVTGKRDRARPLPIGVEQKGPLGFKGRSATEPQITYEFFPPVYASNKIELKVPLPILGEQLWDIWICSFNVPMAPGKTRSIVCSARNFANFTVPGDSWWQVYPRWLEHMTSNLVYDGDMIVLQGQEKALRRGGAVEANSEYARKTFTPTAADRLVLAFRNWMWKWGGGDPEWQIETDGRPLPSTYMSTREMLDRFHQHTEICSSCRGAYHGTKRWAAFLFALSALLLMSAVVPPDVATRAALGAAALAAGGCGAYLKFVLEPKFVFVNYVHADIAD